jgi:hypothetical protein
MDQSAAAVADYGFDGVKLDVRPRWRARMHARTHADKSVAVLRCAWGRKLNVTGRKEPCGHGCGLVAPVSCRGLICYAALQELNCCDRAAGSFAISRGGRSC